MKINHEETKKTKKEKKNLRALRFFVVDFRRSLHVAARRPETMKARL
jgi:valyl-tRNA synthetase